MPTKPAKKKSGLAFWMQRVLEECDRASLSFAPDPVHDLRVALRRCCSMADGIAAIDPDPAWKDMKKAGKRLFRRLGELRDVHVMQEWVHLLDTPDDPVTGPLLQSIAAREPQLQQDAMQALAEFDRKQWRAWGRSLPRRMARFRPGSLVFRHLALERWTEAHRLHRQALRSGSPAAFHRLRIGIKRFRYIVENFLPDRARSPGVTISSTCRTCWARFTISTFSGPAAVRANVFPDDDSRSRWQNRIQQERARRIDTYRKKMAEKDEDSLWQALAQPAPRPKTNQVRRPASPDACGLRSSTLTSSTRGTWPGLHSSSMTDWRPWAKRQDPSARERAIVQAAALLHDVGRSKDEKGHHKVSYRMIRRLPPPLGWRAQDLLTAGIVARYHRGALPRAGQKPLRGLPLEQRQDITRLAAILRLANAFDTGRDQRVQRLQVVNRNDDNKNQVLLIAAQGYSSRDDQAEAIAAARHLLESSIAAR